MDWNTLAAAFEVHTSVALECPVVGTVVAVTMFVTVVASYPLAVAVMVVMAVAKYPVVADKTVVVAVAVAIAYTVNLAQIDLVDRVAVD